MPFLTPQRLRPAPHHMPPAVGGFKLLVLASALLYSGGNNTASATLGIIGDLLLLTVPLVFAGYLMTALAGEPTTPAVALGQKLVLATVLA